MDKKILNNLGKIIYSGEKQKAFHNLRQEKNVEDVTFDSYVQPRTGRTDQDSDTGKRNQSHQCEKGNP